MIQFTDKRLYLKGTCAAYLIDPSTGKIRYYTNKAQTANLETSVAMGEIRAGLGNPISAIIPSDSALNVNFTAADFSLFAKGANAGSTLNYSAVVPVCEVVTPKSGVTSLQVTVSDTGVPAAFYGSSKLVCYVQTVGDTSSISDDGEAYTIGTDGTVADFVATSGKQYKVWYYTNKASAEVIPISTLIDPMILTYVQQMAVYANSTGGESSGTRVGWVYAVVPYLKLGGNASLTGDQSNADTTSITGQAVAYDDEVVSATCSNCGAGNLAYYIYAPDNGSEGVAGLAVVGGTFSVTKSTSAQIPGRLVMENGQLVAPNPTSLIKYAATGAPSGTTVSADGVVSAGSTTGDFDVTMTYPATGTAQYKNTVSVSVT